MHIPIVSFVDVSGDGLRFTIDNPNEGGGGPPTADLEQGGQVDDSQGQLRFK